jgi:hypothetical protein
MNAENFSQRARTIMAILAVLFGLFVVFVGPFLIQNSLDAVLERVNKLAQSNPEFKMPGILLPIWFYLMRAIGVVSGITLVLIAYPIYKGEKWTWPVALICFGLPTMFGVFTTLPHLVQYGRPAPAGIILLLGLVCYWTVLLLKKGDRTDKIARFLVFTMLGVLPGHIIVLVNHGLKGLITNPDKPLYLDPKTTIYGFETPLNFIAFSMCVAAIPLLASRKAAGWWLGLIAGFTALVANYPTHFIRMQTSDFFVGGSLGLLLAIFLLIPTFKTRLLSLNPTET